MYDHPLLPCLTRKIGGPGVYLGPSSSMVVPCLFLSHVLRYIWPGGWYYAGNEANILAAGFRGPCKLVVLITVRDLQNHGSAPTKTISKPMGATINDCFLLSGLHLGVSGLLCTKLPSPWIRSIVRPDYVSQQACYVHSADWTCFWRS